MILWGFDFRLALLKLLRPMLLLLVGKLLLSRKRPAFPHDLFLKLPALIRKVTDPVSKLRLLGGQLGFGFIQIPPACRKLPDFFLKLLHFFFSDAKSLVSHQCCFDFLLPVTELTLRSIEFG